eukprot:gene19873-25825_t
MSIKIYLQYNESDHPEKSSKLSIPSSWQSSKTVLDVINLFIKPYNEKNLDHLIDIDNVHLETPEGLKLYSNTLISDSLVDRNEYLIKPGSYIKGLTTKTIDNRPRCKNYGCNQYYTEEDNVEDSCTHHTGPPIFHDTAKFWSCCPDRKAFDFESFQAIAGCAVSKHSEINQKISIGASPNTPLESVATPVGPVLKSIEEYNTDNTNAATAVDSAIKTLTERKSSRKDDGTARCQRRGCQKIFNYSSENNSDSCCYHQGQPIFHDVAKYWSCCPEKKCYDFDDFLKVPGCIVGYHDDGVIDINN